MDNQQPSYLSQIRPIRRPLYGRVGSIPPGGVTFVQPSPVVATAPPPARVLSQTGTQQPAARSTAEMTPTGVQQMMPATRSLIQRSESTPPALAPPAGATAIPAARPASPQVSGPDSPVTIKADTVTRPPTPASLLRSAISHPVPEPNPPADEPRKASLNGSNNGNGGASERGLWRRSPSQMSPQPPSPRSSGEEEVKRSFPNDTNTHEGSKGSGSVAAGFGMLTIAGENTGAYMELTNGARRPWRGDVMDNGVRRQQAPNGNGTAGRSHRIPADAGVWAQQSRPDGEGRNGSRKVAEEHSSASLHQTRPMSAIANSNVQGINNSILYQSSCSHGSPGVHVTYSRGNNHNHRRRNGVHSAAASSASRS